MKKDEFESAVLDLWVTSAIPLTEANLQVHTGLPRRKVRKWVEELVVDRVLEMDSDDDGELLFTVPGAGRPADGVRSFAEKQRLMALQDEVQAEFARKKAIKQRLLAEEKARRQAATAAEEEALLQTEKKKKRKKKTKKTALARARDKYDAGTALSIAQSARTELDKGTAAGKKSLLLSGGLSLFFGPLGWLYAGSFREAIPAGLAYLLIASILPTFLLMPIAGIALPISGIAGLVYAWQYNRSGQRGRILGSDDDDKD